MSETVVGEHVKNCLLFRFGTLAEISRSQASNKLKSEEKKNITNEQDFYVFFFNLNVHQTILPLFNSANQVLFKAI